MRPELLHIVTAVSNPIRWESRIRLARAAIQGWVDEGAQVTVVECAFGERPYDLVGMKGVDHVPVRARTLAWNKEGLINIGIQRLPHDAKYIAWFDADLHYRKSGWAAEIVHALQQYQMIQPWEHCYDLGPNDEHVETHQSFCALYAKNKPIHPAGMAGYAFAHPGYAWAATRQSLEFVGGLVETAALGAADHHMALALIGRVLESVPGNISPGYVKPLVQWQDRAIQHLSKNIGFLPFTLEHAWHGSKNKRAYVSRWDILTKNHFDPSTDLKRNTYGLLELAGNKPEMAREFDVYLRSRDEDSNSLG